MSKSPFCFRSTLASVIALLAAPSAFAGIMLNNLSESAVGPSAVNGPLGVSESWTAVRFTTGSGTWQLNGLTARFQESSLLNPDGLVIDVRSDGGANPGGTVLGSFVSVSDISADANYAFVPSAIVSLAGNSNYWLVARPTDSTSLYGWMTTLSGADSGSSGWSLADSLVGTADSGVNWTPALPAVPLLSLDASLTAAVPEPGTFSVIAIVSAGWIASRRKRRCLHGSVP